MIGPPSVELDEGRRLEPVALPTRPPSGSAQELLSDDLPPDVIERNAGHPRRSYRRPSGWRFAPHQLRHAHAVEMAHEGVPLIVIQRQLGHSNPGITSTYLQGIDNAEIIEAVRARRARMVP